MIHGHGIRRIARLDRRKHCRRVVQLPVDLARSREGCHALLDQRRQRPPGARHQLGHEQPRNHAGVAIGKVTKVVMRTHLAAINGVLAPHALLDEGMPGLRHHRHAAALLDDVDGVPGQPRIVDDLGPRVLEQKRFGQQPDDVITLDETAALVEQKTAIIIPVPGDAEIRAGRHHRLGRDRAMLRQQGVRHAVREGPVRLVLQLDELKRQMLFQPVDHAPRPAVTGIHHQFHRLEPVQRHVAEQVLDVGFVHIDRAPPAALGCRLELAAFGQRLDVFQTRVAADRLRVLAHELHAVPVRRVVARGDHDAAVHAQVAGGEIDHLRATQADVQHFHAGVHEPFGQHRGKLRRGQPHVVADHDRRRLDHRGVGAADAPGNLRVQVIGQAPADVVSLEAVQ